ncbi:MAG: hypothetical protein MJY82_00300 [Fibrobacter sp.]|nr:hypothetical protein [Fibrobacter sp.]
MKKIPYGIFAALSTFALVGCGDDVTKVYENSGIASVESLKDAECSDENEGELVFSNKDMNMFVCSKGEWKVATGEKSSDKVLGCEARSLKDKSGFAIYCGGDSIGVVLNGVDGKNGADGKDGVDGKNGVNGKDGKNGADGADGADGNDGATGAAGRDGTSGATGAAGTSCKIQSATADTVKIACGDDVSVITLPGAGAKTYSRKVALRIPAADIFEDEDYPTNKKANVTVIALNEKLEPTGTTFTSTLVFAGYKEFSGWYTGAEEYSPMELTFEGTVDAKLTSPYALIRVQTKVGEYSIINDFIEFEALADMQDESIISVTSASNLKVDRVKKLVANGTTFDKAMKQADEELYAAFGFDYRGPIEKLGNEKYAYDLLGMFMIPNIFVSIDANTDGCFNYEVLTDKLKKGFALNGNFNFKIPYTNFINDYCYKFEDRKKQLGEEFLLVDLLNYLFRNKGGHFFELKEYLAKMMEQEYGLPSCANIEKDTVAIVKKTHYSSNALFICSKTSSAWGLITDMNEAENFYNINNDSIAKLTGTCSDKNEWEVYELFGAHKRCEKFEEGEYDWREANGDEESLGFCQSENEGEIHYDEATTSSSMCKDHKWVDVDEITAYLGLVCNENTKHDSVFTKDSLYFFYCAEINDDQYAWENINSLTENEAGSLLFGKCTAERKDEPHSIWVQDDSKTTQIPFICNGSEWVTIEECNADNFGKILKGNDGQYSYASEFVHLKCGKTGNNFEWQKTEDIDIEVGFPCYEVTGLDKEDNTYTYNNITYQCNMETGYWFEY